MPASAADNEAGCVILLHGLARTAASMERLAGAFADAGYRVANVDYPSRRFPIETLADKAVGDGLSRCGGAGRVHFVTHSLGGILVRQYLHAHGLASLGRVVMLAPPNQGSELSDRLRRIPGFTRYFGPAYLQLGTDADSIPRRLPPVDYPVGVIAGTASIDPLSSLLLPGPDDGKVTLASTRLAGMSDYVEVPYSHALIMRRARVSELALRFIRDGSFGTAAR